jgi:hypothetical protein
MQSPQSSCPASTHPWKRQHEDDREERQRNQQGENVGNSRSVARLSEDFAKGRLCRLGVGLLLKTVCHAFKPIGQGTKLIGASEVVTLLVCYPPERLSYAAKVFHSGLRRAVVHASTGGC